MRWFELFFIKFLSKPQVVAAVAEAVTAVETVNGTSLFSPTAIAIGIYSEETVRAV